MRELFRCLAISLATLLAMSAASCTSGPHDERFQQAHAEAPALIEELAARRAPAHETGYRGADLFTTLDPVPEDSPEIRDARRVREAYDRLKALGIGAFPGLVASSDDQRYCYSSVSAAWLNHSVGMACLEIISAQVDYVPNRSAYKGNPLFMYHVRRTIGLKKWWAQRKHRSLRELQIEAVRWMIVQEKKANDLPEDFRRQKILPPLEKRLDELRRAPR